MHWFRLSLFLSLLALSSIGLAQNHERDMQKEAILWEQLRVVNPDLIEVFKQGTDQMDAGNYKDAVATYRKVVDGAQGSG